MLVGGLVLLRVQTGVFAPDAYAQLALAMTVFSFGQVVIYGPLNHALIRLYTPVTQCRGQNVFLTYARRKVLKTSAIWSIVLVGLAAIAWMLGHSDWGAMILSILIYSLFNGALSALIAINTAARARRKVALHQATDAGLKVLFVLCIAALGWATLPALFCAYAMASLFTLLSLLRGQDDSETSADISAITSGFNRFANPVYLWAPFTWALLVADRWALQGFVDARTLALYAVAAQMSLGPVRVAMSAVLRFLSPRFFDLLETDATAALAHMRLITLWALGLTGLGFTFTGLLHDQIAQLLLAPEYRAASVLLPWLVLMAGFSATAELVVLRQFGTLNSAALLRPRIFTAVMGCGLIFLGAWQFGLWGVVAAQCLQSGLFLIWELLRARCPAVAVP